MIFLAENFTFICRGVYVTCYVSLKLLAARCRQRPWPSKRFVTFVKVRWCGHGLPCCGAERIYRNFRGKWMEFRKRTKVCEETLWIVLIIKRHISWWNVIVECSLCLCLQTCESHSSTIHFIILLWFYFFKTNIDLTKFYICYVFPTCIFSVLSWLFMLIEIIQGGVGGGTPK